MMMRLMVHHGKRGRRKKTWLEATRIDLKKFSRIWLWIDQNGRNRIHIVEPNIVGTRL